VTFFITRNDRQRFSSQTVDFNFNWPLKSRLVAGETLAQPLVEFWIIRLPDFIADVDAQKIHVAVAETQLGQFLAGGFETWFLNFINPSAFFFFIGLARVENNAVAKFDGRGEIDDDAVAHDFFDLAEKHAALFSEACVD